MVPPRKLYRIAEIVHHTGISRQTVHMYTVLGLITEAERTKSQYRLYGENTFLRLARIEQLKDEGKSLRQIREILDAESPATVEPKSEEAR